MSNKHDERAYGLYGATFAYLATKAGKKCLVIDKRHQRGGNVYCRDVEGIHVHVYGAHIFHTGSKEVWDFVNSFVPFNRYTNSPVASWKGGLYNLPFNMNTFHEMWGVRTPDEAKARIEEQKAEVLKTLDGREPRNLEEQALSLVGRDIYERLVKGYTEKQWGRSCTELPAFIIRRLPLRFTFDNNYFNDPYQGIPMGGYNKLVDGLLEGGEVRLDTDFFSQSLDSWKELAEKIVYTGRIDEFYGGRFGNLDYRTVRFETETLPVQNWQGNAVVNYTEREVPYTRIIEHKHFEPESEAWNKPLTVISREYPSEFVEGKSEPFYPVNDDRNSKLYARYKAEAEAETNVLFGGRLAEYRYYDMDDVIMKAMADWKREG